MEHNRTVLYVLGALLIGGVYLYVRSRKATPAATSPGTAPAAQGGGGQTVDLSGVTAAIQAEQDAASKAFGDLGAKGDANAQGLATLLNQSGEQIAKAITDTSTATSKGFTDLGNAVLSANASLSKSTTDAINAVVANETQGFGGVNTAISGLGAAQDAIGKQLQASAVAIYQQAQGLSQAEIQAIQQAGTAQQSGLTALGTSLTSAFQTGFQQLVALTQAIGGKIDTMLSQQTAQSTLLATLQTELDYDVGSQSVAICLRPDGSVDAECAKTHAIDLPTAEFNANQVGQLVKTKYAACWKQGQAVDVACVGRVLRGG